MANRIMSTSGNSHGGFYQFPLCLLAQAIPFSELQEQCFDWGIIHYLDIELGTSWRWRSPKGIEGAMKIASEAIGFTNGSAANTIHGHDAAQGFVDKWKRSHSRKTASVRFRTADLHFDVRDRGILSERDWRVLAAILSALGDKPMVRLGWGRIQCRAAGWLTPPPPGAKPCGPLYPRGQIERSLRELLDRGYLFGATYRRGERWWSNRLKHEELWCKISERKLLAAKAAQRRKIDSLGDTRIALKLAEYGLAPTPLRTPAPRKAGGASNLAAGHNGASVGPSGAPPCTQFRIVTG